MIIPRGCGKLKTLQSIEDISKGHSTEFIRYLKRCNQQLSVRIKNLKLRKQLLEELFRYEYCDKKPLTVELGDHYTCKWFANYDRLSVGEMLEVYDSLTCEINTLKYIVKHNGRLILIKRGGKWTI